MRPIPLIFAIALLAACSAPELEEALPPPVTLLESTVEVTREVTVEVTRVVQVPVTVTSTPGPSPTPTVSPTPTITSTFTPTPTPFRTTGCTNLVSVANFWNFTRSEVATRLYPTYDALNGRCVKLYASDNIGIVATDYGWLALATDFDVTFTADDSTPSGARAVTQYSTVWGIWTVEQSGRYRVLLRRVDPFADLQQPIEDDGFYLVGQDYDIASGRWKSLWPPGTIDNCYWARTNPDTGDIRDNHFGQAGTYVRLYDADLFESQDCAPWVFVAP